MSEEPSHEFHPFTSQQARDRYLAHYDAMDMLVPEAGHDAVVAQPELIADRMLKFLLKP